MLSLMWFMMWGVVVVNSVLIMVVYWLNYVVFDSLMVILKILRFFMLLCILVFLIKLVIDGYKVLCV